jgi:aryl-alcohol dehydrogenase-like predicted oxidoreductase
VHGVPRIPGTDLDVSDLCLGGNVFGWTADEPTTFALLDRFDDAVPSVQRPFVDTAESYGDGTSERLLGAWLAERGTRDRFVVATKASRMQKEHPLSAKEIRTAAERSLRNLRTDVIDLYYAHYDDETTPLEETLTAFDELVTSGKIRYAVASNYSAARLTEAMETSERLGVTRYVALQPHYNLMERPAYEDELRDVVARYDLGCFPYFGLARGLFRAVGPGHIDTAIVAPPPYQHPPRIAADFTILDERASHIRLDVQIDLFAAVRTGDEKIVVHALSSASSSPVSVSVTAGNNSDN